MRQVSIPLQRSAHQTGNLRLKHVAHLVPSAKKVVLSCVVTIPKKCMFICGVYNLDCQRWAQENVLDVLPFQKYCNRLIASVLQEWKLLLPWIWALEPEQARNRIHFQRTKIARKGDEEKTGRTSSDL